MLGAFNLETEDIKSGGLAETWQYLELWGRTTQEAPWPEKEESGTAKLQPRQEGFKEGRLGLSVPQLSPLSSPLQLKVTGLGSLAKRVYG